MQKSDVGPPSGPYISLLNDQGRGGLSLESRGDNARIELWSRSGEYKAGIGVNDQSAFQFMGLTESRDGDGWVRLAECLVDRERGAEMTLTDRKGREVVIGVLR